MNKSSLDLEEAFLEEAAGGERSLELALDFRAFLFVGILAGLSLALIISRLIYLNYWEGDYYGARSKNNSNKEIVVRGERGIIKDRYGKPLVKNIPSWSVYVNTSDFFKIPKDFKAKVARLADLTNLGEVELTAKLKSTDILKIPSLLLAKDVTSEVAINLRAENIIGVEVKDDYKREYLDPRIFSHLLGYTGVSATNEDVTGLAGLEAYCDKPLRGKDGLFTVFRDAKGNILDEKLVEDQVPGSDLNLTIDAEFQRYFYKRFEEGLKSLDRHSGVGIAINPQNGEILALFSYPGFDNNTPAKALKEDHKPLYNRAISGVYSPGSTFKPFVATAALKEGVVKSTDEFLSKGYIEIPNPYFPDKPSRFLDWRPQGYVNVFSSLAKSSNVYFYIVGGGFKDIVGLGVDRLHKYWDFFKLGEKTNIDLPSENVGFFWTPAEKEKKTGVPWRVGNTYNVSIGQGDLAMTPIRLITSNAAIANGGKMYQPFIGKSITDDRGNKAVLNKPTLVKDFTDYLPILTDVRRGMRDGVAKDYGTSHALSDIPFPISAKTGSAQIQNNTKTNAFFLGFAPSDKPEIEIEILIEDSKSGSANTIPIAHDVLKWYYENRYKKS